MGKRTTYAPFDCKCGQSISTCGFARFNHMMAHVRRGEAKYRMERSMPFIDMNYVFDWLVKKPKPIDKSRLKFKLN